MENTEKSGFVKEVAKGIGVSVISVLIGILVFAGLLSMVSLSDATIKPVNQFIKGISIFLGCFLSVRKGKGLVKGVLIGSLFTVISYLLFALIGGTLSFGFPFVVDLIFGCITGGLAGILVMAIKK